MNAKETVLAALRGEGCLGKAAEDEEVFVLRAQDLHAPLVVQIWAAIVDHAAGEPTAKAAGARHLAAKMLIWQSHHHKKLPD